MHQPTSGITLTGKSLTVAQLVAVSRDLAPVSLDSAVVEVVARSRAALEQKLQRQEVIYGVNTGFGGNVRFLIAADELDSHQENLLRFLCCGIGEPLPIATVRGSMLLRANALCNGYSGVRPIVIERLIQLLNAGITPVTPRLGSVGASGDLVPSAHIARALLGLGDVDYQGRRIAAGEALRAAGIVPIALKAKEGLALLNGTTVMTSVAAQVVDQTDYLATLMLALVALCGEVLNSTGDAFEPVIQSIKGHPGQIEAARLLRLNSAGSSLLQDLAVLREQIRRSSGGASSTVELEHSIQTPYSLRCAPQGLGPALESVAQAREVVEREMNSVNDNPLIDPNDGRVYHTGNFYGGHVARTMDGLKIDLANIANWGHALMAMLMDPRFSNGLPPNLSTRPGANSGFKGMQLAQTSLVVACRQLCAPSSIHTLPTEQYNQDIVSLGLHSASSAMEMTSLVRSSLSILSLALCQAADLRGVAAGRERLGTVTARLYRGVREVSAGLEADRAMDGDIAALSQLLALRGIDLGV
jgi:phenylalanine ammonia-lyase